MNKLNLYLALLALLTAISVLDYIDEDHIMFVKLIFYVTSLGLILKMMLHNFDFNYNGVKNIIKKLEGLVFYLITLLMVTMVFSAVVTSILSIINLDIPSKYINMICGASGALLGLVIKRKR